MKKIFEEKSKNWLLFYNYKEPLKEIKNGYGYYGAILATEDGTKIQCHLCGGLYSELQAHIRMFHSMKVRDYKEKFELAYTTSLISESIRNERKMRTLEWLKTLTPEQKNYLMKDERKDLKSF